MGRWIFRILILLGTAGGFLAGVIALGRWAQEHLQPRDRYLVPFADIDCPLPPGLSRREFLDEVQYLGRLPDRLSLLEEALPRQLAEAFARHPWVAKVEKVELTPPRHIRVQLALRTPVLAVPVGDKMRRVDGQGVLLRDGPVEGLPIFAGQAKPPTGPAGTPWGDPAVEARAKALRKPQ